MPVVGGFSDLVEVGRGGFSRVYSAYQVEFDRRVALKVLNDRLADDASVAVFEGECRAMGALSQHPFIVTVLASALTADYRPCIVMELFERGNYMQQLRRDGPLPLEELLSLAVRVGGALATAHHHGVVHGDVKPQNILKSEFGFPALGDFGIATLRDRLAERAGVGLSAHYAAPELIEVGATAAGAAADQYSLAATIFTLATGRRPFESATAEAPERVLARALAAPTPRLAASFPADLADALARAMSRDPQARFPDLGAFAYALAAVEHRLGYRATAVPLVGIDDDATITVEDTTRDTLHATQPPTAPPPGGDETTIALPPQQPPPDTPPGPPAAQPPNRRRRLAALAIVLLAAAGAATYLTLQTTTPEPDTADTQPEPPPADAAPAPPSEPTATATRTPADTNPAPTSTTPTNTEATPSQADLTPTPEPAPPPAPPQPTEEPAAEEGAAPPPPAEPSGAPETRFTAVSAGEDHSCGLRTDSTIVCWGSNWRGKSDAPAGTFIAVSAGGGHSCGLHTDSSVVCWGRDFDGQTDAPADTFSAVSAGENHSCGLRTDNSIACWGNNADGQADPPAVIFSAVSAGWEHSCGLRTDSTIVCWGSNRSGKLNAPAGTYTAVSVGSSKSCGLRTDDAILCRDLNIGAAPRPTPVTWLGPFGAVTAGGEHYCSLGADSTITCWGSNDHGEADAPAGTFSAVSAGGDHSCGLRVDSTVVCWGNNEHGQADPPNSDTTPAPPASPTGAQSDTAPAPSAETPGGPETRFTAIAAGLYHSCGVRTDNTITCWGNNEYGEADPPTGTFTTVTVGQFHSCGLRTGQHNRVLGSELQESTERERSTGRAGGNIQRRCRWRGSYVRRPHRWHYRLLGQQRVRGGERAGGQLQRCCR